MELLSLVGHGTDELEEDSYNDLQMFSSSVMDCEFALYSKHVCNRIVSSSGNNERLSELMIMLLK